MRTFKNRCCLLFVLLAGVLTGCTTLPPTPGNPETYKQTSTDGPGILSMVVHGRSEQPRDLPKSRIGNPASYVVFGERYPVLDSAQGFTERGIASWYGSKFHGRKTSSGETYNMYNMTAAHKHLPLPTFVQVTNMDNGRQLVVKVNDRGPFVDDRIIDLSYGAAARLGVLKTGTANVEVVAVSSHLAAPAKKPLVADATPINPAPVSEKVVTAPAAKSAQPDADVIVLASSLAETMPAVRSASVSSSSTPVQRPDTTPVVAAQGTVIQVGAFTSRSNAEVMRNRVNRAVNDNAAIIAVDNERQLHKVQIGPLPKQVPIDQILLSLRRGGIDSYQLFEH